MTLNLYSGNALDILPTLPDGSIDAICTSPPYWGKIDYQHPEQIGLEFNPAQYLQDMGFVLHQLHHLAKPGAILLLNIGDTWNGCSCICGNGRDRKEVKFTRQAGRRGLVDGYRDKELLSIPGRLTAMARRAGWLYRAIYTWDKQTSADSKPGDRARQTTEPILHLLKPGHGDRRDKALYWDGQWIPSSLITARAISRRGHKCPWPYALAEKLVMATTPPGGTILDPFMGMGSAGQAAAKNGRDFVGVELNSDIMDLAIAELTQAGHTPTLIGPQVRGAA